MSCLRREKRRVRFEVANPKDDAKEDLLADQLDEAGLLLSSNRIKLILKLKTQNTKNGERERRTSEREEQREPRERRERAHRRISSSGRLSREVRRCRSF